MSDFNDVTKHLDIVPSRKAAKDEALNNNVPFDKYYDIQKTRRIEKLNKKIQLAAFQIEVLRFNIISYQYNVSMPQDFYLLNPIEEFIGKHLECVVTVRWRVGSVVHRYDISTALENQYYKFRSLVDFEFYNKQKIGKNCVFEVWFIGVPPLVVPQGISSDVTLSTSLLVNPATADDTLSVIGSPVLKNFAALALDVPPSAPPFDPWIFPLSNTNMAWLTN